MIRLSTSAIPGAAAQEPVVSIVIPVFNKWAYTAKCLEQLARNTRGTSHEIIIVDNASSDETRMALAAPRPGVRVHRNETNLGFAKACNQGARMALGRYILFLNNDTEAHPGWLEPLVRILDEEPDVAIVGSKLLFPDGTLQHAGVTIAHAAPLPVSPQHIHYRQPSSLSSERLDLEAVTGACFIIRRETFFEVGEFDEGYVNGCEDIDLCFKVREAGHRVVYTPESVLLHHESVSDGRFLYVSENMVRFHERWLDRYPGFHQPDGERPGAGRDPASAAVSVVLVTRDALSAIAPCLESLARAAGPQDEIVIVDDASSDVTPRFVQSFRHRLPGSVRVVTNERAEGYARSVNTGIEMASRPYVLLLRPEAILTPGSLDRMVAHLERRPEVAAVGPRCDRVEGPQKAVLSETELGFDRGEAVAASFARRFAGKSRGTRLLEDFCLLARRDVLLAAGALDPDLGTGCHDLDLCQRLRAAGHALCIAEDAFVRHFGQLRLRDRYAVKREYLRRQSANALHEKLYRRLDGRVPPSRDLWGTELFQPQTESVSVVIVDRAGRAAARRCAEAVLRHTHRAVDLVLVAAVPGEPLDALAEELRSRCAAVRSIGGPAGIELALACNLGLAAARGEVVALLDSGTVVTAGWLGRQLALLSLDARLGIVGPRATHTPQPQGVDRTPEGGAEGVDAFAAEWARSHEGEFAVPTRLEGACMVIRREVLTAIGGMDTAFGTAIIAADDFCLRAQRAGFKLGIAGDVLVHRDAPEEHPAARLRHDRLHFRSRWEIPAHAGDAYDVRTLAAARPFDATRDHIPVDPAAVFHSAAAPLEIGETRAVRLLCIPEWEGEAWKETFVRYLRTFNSDDPVTLVLRVEPPLPAAVDAAVAAAEAVLAASGVPESAMPDVVFEASWIAARARGGLYTAATALLEVEGPSAPRYRREARGCGLPVAAPATGEELRRVVAKLLDHPDAAVEAAALAG